jgi:fluoride exporter
VILLMSLVFFGGAVGTLFRFGISSWVARTVGPQFPWGTLTVNVVGSFLIGAILGWPDLVQATGNQPLVAFLAVGFCGGLTTFSSFSLQTLALLLEKHWRAAVANIFVSTVWCILAVAGGVGTAKLLAEFSFH